MNMPVIDLSLDVHALIEKHFTGMYSGEIGVSSIEGGQTAAHKALASLDISGYVNNVLKYCQKIGVVQPCYRHTFATICSH